MTTTSISVSMGFQSIMVVMLHARCGTLQSTHFFVLTQGVSSLSLAQFRVCQGICAFAL